MGEHSKNTKYAGFPKYLYHHKHAPDGRLFNFPEETQQLGVDWVDTPAKFPEPSKVATTLKRLKLWWSEWGWTIKAAAGLIGFVAAVVTLLKSV